MGEIVILKIRSFRPVTRCISEMMQDRAIVTERYYEVVQAVSSPVNIYSRPCLTSECHFYLASPLRSAVLGIVITVRLSVRPSVCDVVVQL